jgi:hypothetical protein
MLRILVGMVIGAAIGTGITYRLLSDDLARQAREWRPEAERATEATEPTGPPATVDRGTVLPDGPATAPGLNIQRDGLGSVPAFNPRLDASVDAALERVNALAEGPERFLALQAVAAHWAARDPRSALAASSRLLRPGDRSTYFSKVVQTIARSDPESLVARFGELTSTEDRQAATRALIEMAQTMDSPRRLLELADQLPQPVADSLRQSALQRWARNDPLAALAYAQTMPLGQSRQMALNVAAMNYAREDPQGALVWLQSQPERSPALETGILSGIAQGDPAAAVDLLLANDALLRSGSLRAAQLRPLLMNLGQNGSTDRGLVADRLLSAGGLASEQLLPGFLQGWSTAEPRGALNWLAAQGPGLGANTYAHVAAMVASRDVALAAEFASRVPADARPTWIASVGRVYASRDPEAALAWLGQFRSQPGYADAVLGIAQATAPYDPARAADLLGSVDSDNMQAAGAAGMVALTWSQSDPAAARSWAVGLPSGRQRDAALQMLIANAATGSIDVELLGLFSTDQARMQAAFNGILRVAAGDPERARAMLAQYVPDPAVRARYEEALDNMPSASFGFVTPASGLPLPLAGPFMRGVTVAVPGVSVDSSTE